MMYSGLRSVGGRHYMTIPETNDVTENRKIVRMHPPVPMTAVQPPQPEPLKPKAKPPKKPRKRKIKHENVEPPLVDNNLLRAAAREIFDQHNAKEAKAQLTKQRRLETISKAIEKLEPGNKIKVGERFLNVLQDENTQRKSKDPLGGLVAGIKKMQQT